MDKKQLYNQTEALERVNLWISNCDTKISFALALASAILGIFFTNGNIKESLNKVLSIVMNLDKSIILPTITIIFFIVFIISLLLSIYFLLKGLWGNFGSSLYREEKGLETKSLLFFKTISELKFDNYKSKVININEEILENDYLSQVYINSVICKRKFKNYNRGIICLGITLVSFMFLSIGFLFI